jgi:hypothetical protein
MVADDVVQGAALRLVAHRLLTEAGPFSSPVAAIGVREEAET